MTHVIVYRYLSSQSFVINFIARHSILFCHMNSIVGLNDLGCCQRYCTNIDSVSICRFMFYFCKPFSESHTTILLSKLFKISRTLDAKENFLTTKKHLGLINLIE